MTLVSRLEELAERIEDIRGGMTSTPWCWQPPGHGNGDKRFWSIGEWFEDDPPILLAMGWHEEDNVKGVVRIVNNADYAAAALREAAKELREMEAQGAAMRKALQMMRDAFLCETVFKQSTSERSLARDAAKMALSSSTIGTTFLEEHRLMGEVVKAAREQIEALEFYGSGPGPSGELCDALAALDAHKDTP